VNDLKGEWVFFQNDFLQIFSDILSNSLVNFKKDHTQFLTLLRGIVSKFFQLLHKNPLLAVESMIRFADLQTKDKIINDYDVPQITVEGEDQEEVQFEKQVIPWSKEEDLILVENYDFFREDADPSAGLANLLRDQAYFRDQRDIKMRIKLLKIEKSRDEALKLIEQNHTKKLSSELVVTRLLLYTIAKGRHLEGQVIAFLEDIGDKYAIYESVYPLANDLSWPIVPTEAWQFDLLEMPVMGPLLEYLGCDRPTVGKVWWRARGSSRKVKARFQELHQEIIRLQSFSENKLLDMAEAHDDIAEVRRAQRTAKEGGEQKGNRPKKNSRKEAAKAEKLRMLEEQNKINRELAGLVSDDDEELDLAASDEDDESSHHLDYPKNSGAKKEDDDDEDDFAPVRRKPLEKLSVTSKAISEDKPPSDFREEFREVTNNGHPSSSANFENDGGKKSKRLKKVTKFMADDESIQEDPDNENTDPIQ
jgi:hypothetical protein